MKMTLDIDDRLLTMAKAASAQEHMTLKAFVEEGLRLRLRARRLGTNKNGPKQLPVYRGRSGLAPGIDPTSLR